MQEIPCFASTCQVHLNHLTTCNHLYLFIYFFIYLTFLYKGKTPGLKVNTKIALIMLLRY